MPANHAGPKRHHAIAMAKDGETLSRAQLKASVDFLIQVYDMFGQILDREVLPDDIYTFREMVEDKLWEHAEHEDFKIVYPGLIDSKGILRQVLGNPELMA